MKTVEAEDHPESDAFPARRIRALRRARRPQGAEASCLNAYREGRLAHAWLIGGAEGIGKATLAWRFARFMLANPDPRSAQVREARDLRRRRRPCPPRGSCAALAHPDFALRAAQWTAAVERDSLAENRRRRRAQRLEVFQKSAASAVGASASSIAPRTSIGRRQRAAESDRGAAAALAHSSLFRTGRRSAADDTLALPAIHGSSAPRPPTSPNRRGARRALERSRAGQSPKPRGRASGSVREALERIVPESERDRRDDRCDHRRSARPDPREVAKLADALGGRAAGEAFRAFHRELYDWLAA